MAKFVGQRVALGPRMRECVPLIPHWRNDFAVART